MAFSGGGGSVGAWKNYGGLTDWADGQATNAVTTTAGATWQITDCQLEVGTNASDFEHRSYAEEFKLCQRYYQRIDCTQSSFNYLGMLQAYASTAVFGFISPYPDHGILRTRPTVAQSGDFSVGQSNSAASAGGAIANLGNSDRGWMTGGWVPGSASFTAGDASVLYWTTNAVLDADAEL